MKLDRTGCTRMVLLIGSIAIKIPVFDSWKCFLLGLVANLNEIVWSKAKLGGFAPVLFYAPWGWIVVMRRAKVLSDDEFLSLDFHTWRDRGEYIIPCEAKSNSLGWINGEVVAIDYGN